MVLSTEVAPEIHQIYHACLYYKDVGADLLHLLSIFFIILRPLDKRSQCINWRFVIGSFHSLV